MPLPNNRGAFKPFYDVLDRALESSQGIRIECTTIGDAYQYRNRLNWARKLDQELNRESRKPGDPKYGASDYDQLIVTVKVEEEKCWVYVKHNRIDNYIEEIPA
jgi:hypothetical protein